ncbi:hypothetical protein A3862_16195 [Methylobacterium sp. XJLW]|jgi:hypothetical protein|uniref:hypothetical protein n=1 Tax=Methylobacterium sp. XJLW TaxID=739141 RepID=UPI000DAB0387|nr:hypothetical protein [Methylobacterium sp. XJLW]AWV16852.1 hypothetical protein A3862_16195 [Methylobacterium sp. XJLW]
MNIINAGRRKVPKDARQIGVVCTKELLRAIDDAAAAHDQPRAAFVRTVLAARLRELGTLQDGAPISNLDARRQAAGDAL